MAKLPVKFFTGPSYDAIVEQARAYFECADAGLHAEVLREGNEAASWLVLALHTAAAGQAAVKDRNASWQLLYEDGGVYFELYPAAGSGVPVERELVSAYIQRKGIQQLNPAEVLALLSKGYGRERIAPPQEENRLGEDVAVTLSADGMEAMIRLLAPDEGGPAITMEAVRARLKEAGVVYGVRDDQLEQMLRERTYEKPFVAAQGQPAVHGENGWIEYHFSTAAKTSAPKEDDKGRVDWRTLDLFEPVTEGQLLATRHPPTDGEMGYTVRGFELKPKPGKEKTFPKSKNTVTDPEKTQMRAAASGMVDLTGGVITVSSVYRVDGDCDMGVGNLDFNGSIVISGNVISGMVIKASGNISVGGVVEGSELYAGGSVELKRGMQGMDRGKIHAGGSITAQFIERATVTAGESISVDMLMHSIVEAGSSIVAKGKKGSIMGGSVRATSEITTRSLGSVSNNQTDIEVGFMPQKRARMNFLEKEIQRIKEELEKLLKLKTYMARKTDMDEEKRAQLQASMKESNRQNNLTYTQYNEEYKRLQQEMAAAVDGRVHVLETAYPGVRITIASGVYKVNEQIDYATFKFRDGEVRFVPCEVSGK